MVELDYESHPPCLLDAPELYMQMYICGDLGRVFEIRSPLKPRDSLEYTFVDVEMEIQRDYFEVMDIVGRLFVTLFDSLTASCKKELEAIGREYPFVPLKYLRKTLLLTYQEGIQMLKDAGIDIYPLEDLNMEEEMNLGQLVREKYGTEFYILHRHPLVDKPFNTMPCYDDPAYSNSFYAYIRGKRIISGAQRIDNFEMLIARAQICGIDTGANREYFDVFRAAAPPHGGFRAALEDVVMSFLGIDEDTYVKATSIAP